MEMFEFCALSFWTKLVLQQSKFYLQYIFNSSEFHMYDVQLERSFCSTNSSSS